jgi:hypothetical protein
MLNQIRNALILPADWKVEAPRCAPGETGAGEYEDASELQSEGQEDEQDQP